MLVQMMLAVAMVMSTTLVHAVCTGILLAVLRDIHAARWGLQSSLSVALLIASVVTVLFLASILEATVWAFMYLSVGAIASFEEALYFSIVTYTTLGFGDVTLISDWRLLSSFEAANGSILLGWSTALLFAVVQRVVEFRHESKTDGDA